MPRLHRLVDRPEIFRFPHVDKFFNGMTVWVDGLGRVILVEHNLGVMDMRYYACVKGERGKRRVVGWIRIPMWATLMHTREWRIAAGLGPYRADSL